MFCGGHFLIPQVMDRFLDVLGQTEMDPSRTNDLKGTDFFFIPENFIHETLMFDDQDVENDAEQPYATLEDFVLARVGLLHP